MNDEFSREEKFPNRAKQVSDAELIRASENPGSEEQDKEVKEEPLFYLSELIRTVSRVANKFPDALMEHDLDRLTQAQCILKKHSKTDPIKILSNQNKIQ